MTSGFPLHSLPPTVFRTDGDCTVIVRFKSDQTVTECTESSWLNCRLKLDLTQPLETQGHFDAIVHKVTDILAKADSGNVTAQQYIQNIQVVCCMSVFV